MAANQPENSINTFLENILSLISEAHRQMFCDNIHVIELMHRQLENSLRVLNILHDRSRSGYLYDRQLEENFGVLVLELQELQENHEQ